MANLEEEARDLREKNSELAKELQSMKILVAQKDKEKLELTKEVNELRLKISRLRSGGAAQIRKLDAGLQAASEEALSHLVQASGAVAKTIEIAKQYIQERQDLNYASPKWNNISSSSADKIHKVPPLLLGGQSIQPVVSLSRTMLSNRSINRSPNQNSGVTHRALPIHMLQDVYIPLTRIDIADLNNSNIETEEAQRENSMEDLGLEDSNEQVEQENEESHNLSSVDELEETGGLDPVLEESVEQDEERQENRTTTDNPLEGPSWLLDEPSTSTTRRDASWLAGTLEPDSTTPCETPLLGFEPPPAVQAPPPVPPTPAPAPAEELEPGPQSVSLAFTPTVRRRRRKRSSSPPALRKHSVGRVLKVVVAKMRLSDESPGPSGDSSPPKRQALLPKSPRNTLEDASRRTTLEDASRRSTLEDTSRWSTLAVVSPREGKEVQRPTNFDAPSPNGATDACVIVCETEPQVNSGGRISRRDRHERVQSGSESRAASRSGSRAASRSVSRLDASDSEHSSTGDGETRTRRTRKQVSYKEKPLNRKLRR